MPHAHDDRLPDRPTLESLLAGLLPESETHFFASHLETCTDCADLAGDVVSHDSLVSLLAEAVPSIAVSQAAPERSATKNLHAPNAVKPAFGADDLPAFDPPSRPGDLGRIGPYRLIDRLGAGGMGVVFRGEDTALNRPVAVKILQKQFANQGTAKARFLREARAAASVAGDHVVRIFQVGEVNRIPFIAMELLHGESLADRMRRGDPPTTAEVLHIGMGIAAGLAAAHAAGVLHRDIKPANVWLEAVTGRVKLLDFGLAKPMLGADLTAPGEIAGTPSYVSPEQAAGREVDARSDLFSLGIVLYELATGSKPFPGENAWAALTALANVNPPKPRSVRASIPPALEAAILRLLCKNQAGRPKSAAVALAELRAVSAAPSHPVRWRRWAAGVAVAGIAAAACFAFLRPTDSGESPISADVAASETLRPEAGLTTLWSDDFESGPAAWQLKYAAATAPSGIDTIDGRKALHLVPKADLSANAFRVLGDTKNPFTIMAKVRYAAVPPLSAKYGWRFRINLKADTAVGGATRSLTGDECVLPGRWAEVCIRYANVGFLTEVAVWVDGVPKSYTLAPVSLTERSLTLLELVAGQQDVWFDDVRVLNPESTEASRAWSAAMAAAYSAPTEAHKTELLAVAETLASGTLEDRRLAAAARRLAEEFRPEQTPDLSIDNDRRSVRAARFTHDGRAVVSAGGDGLVRVWDAANGRTITSWGTTRSILPALTVLPDDTVIAPSDGTGKLQAWDLAGKSLYELIGHTAQGNSLTASADGRTLFSAARDGTIRRWDLTTRAVRETLESYGRIGEIQVTASASGTVVAWHGDRQSPKLNGVELVPPARLAPALSPDGTRLLTAGANGSLQCWNAAERTLMVTVPDAGKTLTCAACSPDGRTWAVGRLNGGIELRDGETLDLIARLAGHSDRIYSVEFSRDGRRLVSGSQDNSLRFWRIETQPMPQ